MPTINQYNVNDYNGNLVYSIIENPLVEPLDGPLLVDHLLQRFPQTIYSHSRETHLYRFLKSLVGDSGAGILKKQTLYLRLKNEGCLISYEDLDGAHTTFGFARLPSESYTLNAKTSYLTSEEWNAIQSADMSYRKRIMDFYNSTRYGNSPEGMRLASTAGSGQETKVTENYKYIFDLLSDDPIGVEYIGNTTSINEFIVQPATEENPNNVDHYAILTITEPENGFLNTDKFRFSYGEGESNTDVFLLNVTPAILSSAILGLSAIEIGDAEVTQITNNGYKITFTNPDLNVLNLKIIYANLSSGADIEISYSFIDPAFYTTDFGPPRHEYYDAVIQGLIPEGSQYETDTSIWLNPANERNMNDVLSRLKPISTIHTFKSTTNRKIEIPINSVHATSKKFTINRFIRGNPDIKYTEYNPIKGYYITPNFESEERTLPLMGYDFPVISLTIDGVIAYSGLAKSDLTYNTQDFYNVENLQKFISQSYANGFSSVERSIFPLILGSVPSGAGDINILFSAERVFPDYNTQATITSPIIQ